MHIQSDHIIVVCDFKDHLNETAHLSSSLLVPQVSVFSNCRSFLTIPLALVLLGLFRSSCL